MKLQASNVCETRFLQGHRTWSTREVDAEASECCEDLTDAELSGEWHLLESLLDVLWW